MSDHSTTPSADGAAAAHDAGHHGPSYVKIWGILVALLVLSVLGPMLEIKVLTLLTAFGIAFVKAYIVVRYFMHINVERKWIPYLLATMVLLMALMVGAVSPDVMRHTGTNWENVAAKQSVERGEKAALAAPAHGGDTKHGDTNHGDAAPAHH